MSYTSMGCFLLWVKIIEAAYAGLCSFQYFSFTQDQNKTCLQISSKQNITFAQMSNIFISYNYIFIRIIRVTRLALHHFLGNCFHSIRFNVETARSISTVSLAAVVHVLTSRVVAPCSSSVSTSQVSRS